MGRQEKPLGTLSACILAATSFTTDRPIIPLQNLISQDVVSYRIKAMVFSRWYFYRGCHHHILIFDVPICFSLDKAISWSRETHCFSPFLEVRTYVRFIAPFQLIRRCSCTKVHVAPRALYHLKVPSLFKIAYALWPRTLCCSMFFKVRCCA